MKKLFLLLLPAACWAQPSGNTTADSIVRGTGVPSASNCNSAAKVGRVYIDQAVGGLEYACLKTGASSYAWTSQGGGTPVVFPGFNYGCVGLNSNHTALASNANCALYFGVDTPNWDGIVLEITPSFTAALASNGYVGANITAELNAAADDADLVGINAIANSAAGNMRPIDNLTGMDAGANHSGSGALASAYGVYSQIVTVDGSVAAATNYYSNGCRSVGMGVISTCYSLWTANIGGRATNAYSFWSDEQGVYRIRSDNTFNSVYQAIPALYNPQATKYTPGAANYERIVEQWESNVAFIATENGGTGTLRSIQIDGAVVGLGSTTHPVNVPNLTASLPILTDSSKNLISGTIHGNTTRFQMSDNSGTSGNVAKFDASGNVADGGVAASSLLASGGPITGATYATATNCADSAGAAACGSAAAGRFVADAAATTVVVSTTAVTANSEIFIEYDSSLSTALSVTCNAAIPSAYAVTARTGGTSFTLSTTANVANPGCFSYHIVN